MSAPEEMPVFPSVDRREPSVIRDNQVILLLVQQVHDKIEAMDARLTQHMTDETLTLAEEIANLMNKAFPQGDPAGHRLEHELRMQESKDRADFWKKMLFEVSKYGLIGVVSWLAFVAWAAFLKGPK